MTRITLISIARPPRASDPTARLLSEYLERSAPMLKTDHLALADEAAFRRHLTRQPGCRVTLLDPRGKSQTSEAFAASISRAKDEAVRQLIFAIGPANGWSADMLAVPGYARLSFGPMTLPHELALVVLAEQVYRALTILAGHPYHCGH